MKIEDLSDEELAALENANGDVSKIPDSLLDKMSASEPVEEKPASLKQKLASALQAAVTWTGGMVRNAATQAQDFKNELEEQDQGIPARPRFTREGDTMRALVGKAPDSKEYMERMGVPEGGRLSDVVPGFAETGQGGTFRPEKGGFFDVTGRGAVGAAIDMVTDPVTYAAAPLSALARAGKLSGAGKVANAVVNPIESLQRAGAKAAYKGAFGKLNRGIPKEISAAEIARKTGFVGDAQDFVKHLENLNNEAGTKIGKTLKDADAMGAVADLDKVSEEAINVVNGLRAEGLPESNAIAAEIEKKLKSLQEKHAKFDTEIIPAEAGYYPGMGTPEQVIQTRLGAKIPVSQANEIKARINDFTKFGSAATEDTAANAARKAVSTPLSTEIKQGVGDVDELLLEKLREQNKLYSSTSPRVQQKAQQFADEVPQLKNPLTFSKTDWALLGAGGLNPVAWAGLAGKKMGDVALSTRGRTATGYILDKLGQNSSSVQDTLNRELWLQMLKEGQKDEKK